MEKSEQTLLKVKNISKEYNTKQGKTLTAVSEVSFNIMKGEALAIVGESGCGKSTLAKLISHMELPTRGDILFHNISIPSLKGKELKNLYRNVQVIHQNPFAVFSPRMQMKDFLCEPFIHFEKMSKKKSLSKALQLLERVELDSSCLPKYAHELSGGQLQRIVIARAIALNPSFMICDEVTSALDVSIQQQIMELFTKLRLKEQITILFICHDLAVVQKYCDRILFMYKGSIMEQIRSQNVVDSALHPYSRTLIQSVLTVEENRTIQLEAIEDGLTNLADSFITTEGCLYSGRCNRSNDICKNQTPSIQLLDNDHQVRCHTL